MRKQTSGFLEGYFLIEKQFRKMPEAGACLVLQGRQGGQGDCRGEGEGRRVSGKGRASERRAGPGRYRSSRTPVYSCVIYKAWANEGWNPASAPLPQPCSLVWVGLYTERAVPESYSYQGPVGAMGFPRTLTSTSSEKGSHWRALSRRVHDLAYTVPGWPKGIYFILKNKDIASCGSRVKK